MKQAEVEACVVITTCASVEEANVIAGALLDAQLAACMPNAQLSVRVNLTTEERGFDRFQINARELAPNRDYTIFLLQQAGAPFGAAEYIGDFSTDDHGNAEKMPEPDGVSPFTAHTTNPVPLIATENGLKLRGNGELADLAPTVLDLLGFAKPLQMTGESLFRDE